MYVNVPDHKDHTLAVEIALQRLSTKMKVDGRLQTYMARTEFVPKSTRRKLKRITNERNHRRFGTKKR